MWSSHVVSSTHMVTQVGPVEEGLTTYLALVGPIACMALQMILQV